MTADSAVSPASARPLARAVDPRLRVGRPSPAAARAPVVRPPRPRGGRYQRVQGDLMAAGVTYFAFLGLFPVLLLVASVVGLFLAGDALLQQELFDAIRETFPGELGEQLVDQLDRGDRRGRRHRADRRWCFLYAGLRTMDKLRIGMERIWKGRSTGPTSCGQPAGPARARGPRRRPAAQPGADRRGHAGDDVGAGPARPGGRAGLRLCSPGSSASPSRCSSTPWSSCGCSGWCRRRRTRCALLPGALFGAAGLEVLKLIGGYYLSLISDSVTASAFGGAVGLLVWINLVSGSPSSRRRGRRPSAGSRRRRLPGRRAGPV